MDSAVSVAKEKWHFVAFGTGQARSLSYAAKPLWDKLSFRAS